MSKFDIQAQLKDIAEQERIDRFVVGQLGRNSGMGRPVRAKFSRVKAAGLMVAGGCAAVLLLAYGAVLDKAHGAEREITCTRVRVTDGDTLRCNGRAVRLQGIDAPECRSYPCQDAASRKLRDLTSQGTVRCTIVGDDRYGRAVGRCRTGARGDVAEDLRRGGYVRRWKYGREPKPYRRY